MVNSRMKALDRKNEVATWIANASADRALLSWAAILVYSDTMGFIWHI